jgi:hypothetical protein
VPVSCPHCQRKAIRRSKRRGMFDVTVLSVIPMRPFRCEDCDQRFYGFVWPTDTTVIAGHARLRPHESVLLRLNPR